MRKTIDLIFSCMVIFLSVFVGGLALRLFYYGQYIQSFVVFVGVLYLFGIGCMGLDRLSVYVTGKCRDEAPESPI